jgi:hypothetical protein
MKAKYMILLAFFLFSQIDALAHVNQKVLHTESQYSKVCPLQDGNCLVLSTKTGSSSRSTMSKLDKDGEILNHNLTLDVSFTGGAELVEPKIENKEERDYHLFYHKNKGSKEMTATFDDSGNTYLNNTIVRKNSLYRRISAVALKNGRVLVAGITNEVGEERVEITMYNPKTENKIIGITLEPAYSKYISCFEQKENDVYCVFVTFENEFISKLIVNHLKVSENSLVSKEKKVVKTFFTEFNFVKAVPLNDTDFLILFQTGNPANDDIYGKLYGNSGKEPTLYEQQLIMANGGISSEQGMEYIHRIIHRPEKPDIFQLYAPRWKKNELALKVPGPAYYHPKNQPKALSFNNADKTHFIVTPGAINPKADNPIDDEL